MHRKADGSLRLRCYLLLFLRKHFTLALSIKYQDLCLTRTFTNLKGAANLCFEISCAWFIYTHPSRRATLSYWKMRPPLPYVNHRLRHQLSLGLCSLLSHPHLRVVTLISLLRLRHVTSCSCLLEAKPWCMALSSAGGTCLRLTNVRDASPLAQCACVFPYVTPSLSLSLFLLLTRSTLCTKR